MNQEAADKKPHVSYGVMEDGIKTGEAKLASLEETFSAEQKKLAALQQQADETRKTLEKIQLNHIAIKSQVDGFKAALQKMQELDKPAS